MDRSLNESNSLASFPVDPLANPKGIKRLCELCQKPAFIQCARCRVTYYCGANHQHVDWVSIHEKICQMLIPLRTTMPTFSSEEERVHRKRQQYQRQKHMVDLTRTAAQKLLFEGKHADAVPAAMQCLRYTVELYGLASVELVPAYLLLGEASIGMGKLSQAEEYLSQAQWTVLKTPECPNSIKHKLCRNLGLLYSAKGQYERALKELADDIYHASEEYGTHDIRTGSGYFHMANIFFRQGNMDTANSLYEEVTDIWHEYLSRQVQEQINAPKNTSLLQTQEDEVGGSDDDLDEAQQAEAVQILSAIYDMMDNQGDGKPINMAKIAHATAMLYYIIHDLDKAKEFGRKAVGASAGIQDESFARTIVDFLKVCENVKVE